jgi:hypothetical protein
MIERVTQTIHQEAPNALLARRVVNLPRASLLEISYRIKPINFTFTGQVEGLQLTFGIGNPPDFGLGQISTQTLKLPQQFAGPAVYEKELAALKLSIISLEVAASAAETVHIDLAQVRELTEHNEPGNTTAILEARAAELGAQAEADEAQARVDQAQNDLAQLELQKAEGWTPYVTAAITRSFDALRLDMLATGNAQFTLDYQLVVSRPEDTGPTYTQPFATAGGR